MCDLTTPRQRVYRLGYECGSSLGKTTVGFFAPCLLGLHKLCDPRNGTDGQFSGAARPCNSRKTWLKTRSSSGSIYISRAASLQRFMLIDLPSLQPGVFRRGQATSASPFLPFFHSFLHFIRCPGAHCPWVFSRVPGQPRLHSSPPPSPSPQRLTS